MKHEESPVFNALVIGWYGAPNVGDEVLLDVLKTSIELRGGALIVASVDPALTREMHGVESVDFYNLGEIAQALLWSDVLIMGGGGIFQDHYPFHLHPIYDPVINDISAYARPILMARQFGVPVVIWGHGVGPLVGPEAREIVRDIFNNVMAASVRDQESLNLLKAIGVDRPITVGADPGWLYKQCCVHDVAASVKPQKRQGDKKALMIVVREWVGKGSDWKQKLAAAIDKVVDDEWQIKWVAFQANIRASNATSDCQLIDDIRNAIPERVRGEVYLPKTPLEAWGLLASADAIFSMRLHASILGLLANKPLVGLEYDDKMSWAHEMAGLPAVMRLQLNDSEERYIQGLRAAMGKTCAPWIMEDSRIAQLEESASIHLTLLDHISVRSASKKHWAGGRFNWLATWLQQTLTDLRETRERSRLAHELLQYRDLLLNERDAELDKQARELAALRVELVNASLEFARVETALGESQYVLAERNNQLDLLEMEFRHEKAKRENMKLPDDKKKDENQSAADRNKWLHVLRMEWQEALDEVDQKSAYIAEKEVYIAQLICRVNELEERVAVIGHELRAAEDSWSHVRRLLSGIFRRFVRVLKMPFKFLVLSKRHGFHFALRQTVQRFQPRGTPEDQATATVGDRERVTVAPQAVRSERLLVICHSAIANGWPTRSLALVKAAARAGFFVRWCSPMPMRDRDQISPDIALLEANEGGLLAEVRAEVTRVVLADLSPSSLDLAKNAKEQGAKVILDLSSVDLDMLSPDQFTRLSAIVSRAISREGAADVRLPNLQVQCLPDGADNEEFDSYRTYAYPDSFRRRRRNILVFVAGQSAQEHLKDFITTYPLDRVHVVGDVEGSGIERVLWKFPVRASMLAASDVVVIISDSAAQVSDYICQSARSALIMERPVISNVPLSVSSSKNLHLLNGRTLAQVIDSVEPVEDYSFVSSNTWLSRVEQLMQADFPCSVSVVILIHNNRKIVERCISTMLYHCGEWVREIVVVDNQSTDGGAELVEKLYTDNPKVKLVRNSENGCSSGRNLGVKSSTGEYIAFFDSDQWLTSPSCFAEAIQVLEKNHSIGTIGWNAGWFDARRSDLGGPISDYIPNRGMNADALLHGYRYDIGFLGTSGMFIKRALFESIEGFDTFYDPTCFEDTDICFQIKKAGFAVAFRDLAGIRHQPHQTTGASAASERYTRLFNRNADYFRKKWANYPGFFVDFSA